jgi:hypothetical protein
MAKKNALQTAVFAVNNVDANIGTQIPQNMFRYIYRVKWTNLFNGPNLLTLGKRENGAGATTVVDTFQAALQYDNDVDPDELREESLPLYAIGGTGATGASFLRAVCSAAGTFALTIWYEDAPTPS